MSGTTTPAAAPGAGPPRGRWPATRALVLAIFLLALVVRAVLLLTVWDDLRHGSAAAYGSAALGLRAGAGLTTAGDEIRAIAAETDNAGFPLARVASQGPRAPFTEFLPGPAVLLRTLWTLTGTTTFAPYLLVQALLDALLIAAWAALMLPRAPWPALLTALGMALNPAAIKRVLMMGYDFWPQLGVLVFFTGGLLLLTRRRAPGWWLVWGLVLAVPVWFRELTTFLPLFAVPFLWIALARESGLPRIARAARLALLVLPIVVSVGLLSEYRARITGNARPTRSTFWHTFFAGVGQFDNPYGLEHSDRSVIRFAQRLEPRLVGASLDDLYNRPDSLYEQVLRRQAGEFVREHPGLFLRNAVYRVAIMASPLLYRDSDLWPPRLGRFLLPVGVVMLAFWAVGLRELWRHDRTLLLLVLAVQLYFFVAFGWFYVVGRVILPGMFLTVLVDLYGLRALLRRGSAGKRFAA